MRKCYRYILTAVVFFLFGAVLLYVPSVAGLADNTDFIRVTRPLGMIPDKNLRFFYFQRKFEYIRSFDNLGHFLKFVLYPGVNESSFKSTQFVFVKAAQVISGVISYLKTNRISHFDITALSSMFLALHSISVTWLFKNLRTGKKACDFFLLLIIVTVFFCMGYLLYYNSLFGESVILWSFLLWFSALVHLLKSGKRSYSALTLYFMSAIVFTGAKVANIPLGFLIGIFSIYFFFNTETAGKKVLVILGVSAVFAASVYFYTAIPSWMKKPNNYHSIFFGILKNSENPEEDLEKLGIDAKYAVLADTNVYVDLKGFDVFSPEFEKEVHDKAGPVEVTLYYLKNPGRMMEKLNISAEASLFIRPPYLGNYQVEDNAEILKFAGRNLVWEWLRKQFTGHAFAVITLVFVLYTSVIVHEFLLHMKTKCTSYSLFLPAKILLMVFALSQWIFPVIGNGEADLVKHMFLFNLLLDTMIIVLAADIVKLTAGNPANRRFIFPLLGLLVISAGLLAADSKICSNGITTFGKYNGKAIEWEILDESGSHYFLQQRILSITGPFHQKATAGRYRIYGPGSTMTPKTVFCLSFQKMKRKGLKR